MSSFSSSSRTIRIPNSHQSVDLIDPTDKTLAKYKPEISRPPFRTPEKGTKFLNPEALKVRGNWVKTIRDISTNSMAKGKRKLSDRYEKLLQMYENKVKSLRDSKRRKQGSKEDLVDEVVTIENFIKHTWDHTHGPEGLAAAVVSQAAAMAECRLLLEYGDNLADSLKTLKSEAVDGAIWLDKEWTEVATLVKAERDALDDYDRSQQHSVLAVPPPPTPFLDAIRNAANQIDSGITPAQIEWEIILYAERCLKAHSGVKGLIEKCDFKQLGIKIHKDLKLLDQLFRGRSKNAEEMKKCLLRCKDEFFDYVKEGWNGQIYLKLSQKALDMERRMKRRAQSKRAQKEREEEMRKRDEEEENTEDESEGAKGEAEGKDGDEEEWEDEDEGGDEDERGDEEEEGSET